MSILARYVKQPAEVETYTVDYLDDLTANDNLMNALSAVSPPGLTIDYTVVIDAPGDRRVRVKVSGGTAGVKYKVTVTTTTADARVLQDEFFVTIKDY